MADTIRLMATAVVTGGAGFLGSHLCEYLLDQGFRMLAYGGDLWLYQSALREGVSSLQKYSK